MLRHLFILSFSQAFISIAILSMLGINPNTISHPFLVDFFYFVFFLPVTPASTGMPWSWHCPWRSSTTRSCCISGM